MNPERWRQIESLYHAALEREPEARRSFLDKACDDADLRREVETLLKQDGATFGSMLHSTVTQLAAGVQLGPYKIEAQIGAGGMGEVYRAMDTRLDRKVAIKVSAKEYSDRFEREARAISALNHPHICTLHDVGPNYLVMELCQGETLAARLKRGPLSLEQTVQYGAQIAGALAEAHSKGIVHRDLKPGNVMITKSGVKVLDFGLAKSTQDHTLTARNAVMGTPAYMAPEQREGKVCDTRTDIFALGLVLYEMATGKRPAQGQAAAMESAPPQLAPTIERCLARDPEDRWYAAKDVAAVLEWAGKSQPAAPVAARRTTPRWAWSAIALACGGAILAAIGTIRFGAWTVFRASAPPSAGLSLQSSLTTIANQTGTERSGAISPDGKTFAFVSNRSGQPDIWVRQVSGGDAVQITHDAKVEQDLVYSPDGESVYYATGLPNRVIWRLSALGGSPQKVVENGQQPAPSPDGKRVAYISGPNIDTRGGAIAMVNVDGTGEHEIAPIKGVRFLHWSPDGRWLGFTGGELFDTFQVHLLDPDGKNERVLTQFQAGTIFSLAWLPDSHHIVFSQAASQVPEAVDLFGVSVDDGGIRRLTLSPKGHFVSASISADGKRLVGSMMEYDNEIWKLPLNGDARSNGAAAVRLFDKAWEPMWTQIPRAGMLLFNSPATGARNLWVASLDHSMYARQITFLPGGPVSHAALSPDGSQVAYVSTENGNGQVWVATADGSAARQLTHVATTAVWPFWSPDGKWIAFQSNQNGLRFISKVSPSGGNPIQITRDGVRGDWSPDGSRIAYDLNSNEIRIVDASSGKLVKSISAAARIASPVWSPDGKKISVTSLHSVWIVDPENGGIRLAVQFPDDFDLQFRAAWTADGKSLIVDRQQQSQRIVLLENF